MVPVLMLPDILTLIPLLEPLKRVIGRLSSVWYRSSVKLNRRPHITALPLSLDRCHTQVPFSGQGVSGGVQESQKRIHPACKFMDSRLAASRHRILPFNANGEPEEI